MLRHKSGINRHLKLVGSPLKAMVEHRALLKQFVIKDIKGRFAGSFGGIVWTVVNPLVTIVVYSFVFGMILRVRIDPAENGTGDFFLYFLAGFIPWLILAESLTRSVGILLENANMITKVVFPVELLPLSVVLSALVTNTIAMIIFLVYILFQGMFHVSWIGLVVILLFQMFFAWGLANLLSASCVFIRDMRELLGIFLMVWFYATPVIYPISMVPDFLKWLVQANPAQDMLQLYRSILLMNTISWPILIKFGLIALGAYAVGSWFFMRAKSAFGDVL